MSTSGLQLSTVQGPYGGHPPTPCYPNFCVSAPASFTTLPHEVLIIIFRFFLAPKNVSYSLEIIRRRTTLLLLSIKFNKLVRGTPSLWSYILISGPVTNHARAQRCLDHAHSCVGLWWVFDIRNDESSPAWATKVVVSSLLERYLTRERMERTTELHFIVDPDHVPTIFSHLRSPAPVLQEFRIAQGNMYCSQPLQVRDTEGPSSPTPITLEDGFLAGSAPNLERIILHHTPISRTGPIFNIFTGNGRSSVQYLDLSQQGEMRPDVFYDLLGAISTSITSLVLRNAGPTVESEDSRLDMLPPARGGHHQGLKSETHTYKVDLPFLTSLVIGGMTAKYLDSLLFTLRFRPLASLGVHGIYDEEECEATWDVLSLQSALLAESGQCDETNRAFGSISTLELYGLPSSLEMKMAYSMPVEGGARKTGEYGCSFQRFLDDKEALKCIRMRRVGIEFVKAIGVSLTIPAPALECLEACCIVDFPDGGSLEPEVLVLDDVRRALLDILKTRLKLGHRIGRLHLDGDEWNMRKGSREKFINSLAELKKNIVPIVHWDARAPFFADYYDTLEF